MVKRRTQLKRIKQYSLLLVGSLVGLLVTTPNNKVEGAGLGGPTHIGTFEGSTTFTTSSSNGVNPGLFIEVMDEYGNLTQYESEEGVITVTNTKEGAYVTQAKLLGKTKYRDQDTGELLEEWEEGRNLELVSVENPVLTTIGKNILSPDLLNHTIKNSVQGYAGVDFNYDSSNGSFTVKGTFNNEATLHGNAEEFTKLLQHGKTYYASEGLYFEIHSRDGSIRWNHVFTFDKNNHVKVSPYYQWLGVAGTTIDKTYYPQVEIGTEATGYEPYQSSVLSCHGGVVLRSFGNVQDTLNLITGEYVQNIKEMELNGRELYNAVDYIHNKTNLRFDLPLDDIKTTTYNGLLCDKLPVFHTGMLPEGENTKSYIAGHADSNRLVVIVEKNKLLTEDMDGFKKWLAKNPITIQYQLATKSVETLVLDSTYYFQPVMNRDVYVDGSILPLVCSVTIPTESLAFVLNPNAEAGQQFIAPEFTVVNHTPTSIYLELKRFEQLTTVMNDVLPEAHEDWSQLNREQSKDIALALVPKPSEGWLNLEEGPRYVAEDSNYYLGEVKAESSVDFTFIASHGRAFVQPIDPKYRLSFVFDFFE